MDRIRVIIVHGGGRDLLKECLGRLLASSGVHIDVSVVANACDEALPSIVESDARIRVVTSADPLGFSSANNLAIRDLGNQIEAPDHYLFLNNDAFVEPNSLEILASRLAQRPRTGIVGPRLMIWGGKGHLNSLGINVTVDAKAWDEGIGVRLADYGPLPQTGPALAVTGAALMIRSAALSEIGGWEPFYDYYYEDIDLCLRARNKGWEVECIPDAVIWHSISASSAEGSDFKTRLMWRNRLLLPVVHWPFGLLCRIGPRMVLDELTTFARRCFRAPGDARMQIETWLAVLVSWVDALRARPESIETEWTRLLKPLGSIPEISLPQTPAEDTSAHPID